jgi:hypothetical protein
MGAAVLLEERGVGLLWHAHHVARIGDQPLEFAHGLQAAVDHLVASHAFFKHGRLNANLEARATQLVQVAQEHVVQVVYALQVQNNGDAVKLYIFQCVVISACDQSINDVVHWVAPTSMRTFEHDYK